MRSSRRLVRRAFEYGGKCEMNEEKILSMIGLAKRANKVSTGEFICKKVLKQKKARLAILAENASDNTKKSIINSCKFYNVEVIECSNMENLGKFTGGGARAVVTINDENFANEIMKYIK